MNPLKKILGVNMSPTAAPAQPEAAPSLERMLLMLERRGKPRLSRHNNGWFACIEMNTSAAGACFEIKSEFGHAEPMAAVQELAQRVNDALKAMGATQ
jgi:hypothetical protein